MFVNYRSPLKGEGRTKTRMEDFVLFADQASIAIHNAQLYRRARRSADVFRVVGEAGRAVTAPREVEDILKQTAERAYQLTRERGGTTGIVEIWEVASDNVLRAVASYPEAELEEITRKYPDGLQIGDGLVGRVVANEAGELIRTSRLDERLERKHGELCSAVAVPIRVDGKVTAVIQIEIPVEDAFEQEDKDVLELLSGLTGAAIQNARTKGLVGVRAARAWMSIAYIASGHRIVGSAATIEMLMRNLQTALEGGEIPQTVAVIEAITEEVRKIQITPITAPLGEETSRIDLHEFVSDILQQWRKKVSALPELIRSAEYNIVPSSIPNIAVKANPEWLRYALDIIIHNSLKAMKDKQTRELSVEVKATPGRGELWITDTGCGVPDAVKEQLLKNQPVRFTAESSRWGVGLLLADMIMESYGGGVRLERTSSFGTTMVLWLARES
jgi:signal transduction histidine kinase